MVKLPLLGLIGSVAAAVYAVAQDSTPATVLALGVALASIEIAVIGKIAGGFTAVVIPVFAINGVLLTSLFLWDRVRAESIVSLNLEVPEQYHVQAAAIGIVFSGVYTIGAVLAGPRGIHMSLTELADLGSTFRVPNRALVILGYSGIALTIYARRGALLEGHYLGAEGPAWALNLSNAVTPIAMLALCIAAARPGPWRAVAAVGVGLWFLILFGRASRTLAALPAMIIFARAFAGGKRPSIGSAAFVTLSTIILLQLPLAGRLNQDGVGILPLGEQLLTRPNELFTQFSLGALLGNVLFSGPLTALVANRSIPFEAFWISIDPMPGVLAGWYEIRDSMRLDESTPYNALGELGAYGWVALVTVAFAVGFAVALSTRMASSLSGAYAITAAMLVLGLAVFFSVSILQYNLRSSVRLVWYMLFSVVAISLASTALRSAPRRRLESTQHGQDPISRDPR